MSNRIGRGALSLMGAFILISCGGGGGAGGSAPPPAPVADTTPPDTAVTTVTTASTASRSATFNVTATESNSSFESSVDGGAYSAVASPFTLNNVADGAHTLNVRARDAAGNVDATPASFSWTVDGTAPVARILFPPAQGYTDATTITVRGTAQDAGTISAITVAGVAATAVTANFTTWSAQVPLASGDNTLEVVTTDSLGNTRTAAATAHVRRGGAALGLLGYMAFDAPRNRLLGLDVTSQAIYAIPAAGGDAQIVSDAARGTGPLFDMPMYLDFFGGNLIYAAKPATDELISVDVVSGNRTVVSAPSPNTETQLGYTLIACNSPCTTLYATSPAASFLSPSVLFSIDVATGARTPISGGTLGSGPQFAFPQALLYDTSAGSPYPRVLLTNASSKAVYEINLQTGARALVSQANTIGTGPEFLSIAQMRLDPATGKLIVLDCDRSGTSTGCDGRLLLVDLATGDRLQIVGSSQDVSLSEASTFAMDPTPGQIRLFLNSDDNARIAKVDYSAPSRPLTAFYDVAVGSGSRLGYSSSVSIESTGTAPSLLLTSLKPDPQIVRVDLATGNRSSVSANGPNSGTPLRNPGIIAPDTRAGAPANRLLLLDAGNGNMLRVVSVDTATGNRIELMPPTIPYQLFGHFPVDAPGNRVIAWAVDTMTNTSVLSGFDLGSGISTLITGAGRGAGPALTSRVESVGILEAAGAARRFLLIDAAGRLISVDPASGDRTEVSSNSVPILGFTPDYDRMAVDTGRQRVFLTDRLDGAILGIDLATGNRTIVSGFNRAAGVFRGAGARFASPANSSVMDYDPSAELLYVAGAGQMVIAIDVATGDRVVVSR